MMWHKVRFKLVWIEFSVSYTGCLTMAKEPNLPYNLPIDGRGGMYSFLSQRHLHEMKRRPLCLEFEYRSPITFPSPIIVAPIAFRLTWTRIWQSRTNNRNINLLKTISTYASVKQGNLISFITKTGILPSCSCSCQYYCMGASLEF